MMSPPVAIPGQDPSDFAARRTHAAVLMDMRGVAYTGVAVGAVTQLVKGIDTLSGFPTWYAALALAIFWYAGVSSVAHCGLRLGVR